MGKIIALDESTFNRIAAGEVIDRPSSILKELIENSIDAGASQIFVEIVDGGISCIKVADNGSGMDSQDAVNAFMPHYTSKIRSIEDLDTLRSLGFRGEALASIAAVSKVEMLTRLKTLDSGANGTRVVIKGGRTEVVSSIGCPEGTSITVTDLFFNTPARFKFLKRDSTEAGYIFDIVSKLALGNPGISFTMSSQGKVIMRLPGDGNIISAIFGIYGKDIANNISRIEFHEKGVDISGYAGLPGTDKKNRNDQSFYINGRYFRSKMISAAIDQAYKTIFIKGRYPFVLMYLEMSPVFYDVNVHPQKMEVRFLNESDIFRKTFHAVNNTLLEHIGPGSIRFGTAAMSSESNDIDSSSGMFAAKAVEMDLFIDAAGGEDKVIADDNEYGAEKYVNSSSMVRESKTRNTDNVLLSKARIIGRLFSTYLLLEMDDIFYIVDQHAAHERIIYERLINNRKAATEISQPLAVPSVLNLNPMEMAFFIGEIDFIRSLGYDVEIFGNASIIIRSVPFQSWGTEASGDLKSMIESLMNEADVNRKPDYEKAIYSLSCKLAVKAFDRIGNEEIKNLLQSMDQLKNPFTCPHGRPSIVSMPKIDMERLFRRRQA